MRILIVKTSSLGDIVQSFPVIDYIRQKMPQALIDWVVEDLFSELVEAHPEINRTIKVSTKKWRRFQNCSRIPHAYRELRKEKYDVVFDLQGNSKSSVFTLLARSCHKVGFGWSTVPERPNLLFTHHRYNPPKGLNVRDEYLHLVQCYFEDNQFPSLQTSQLKISDLQRTEIEALLSKQGSSKIVLVCPGSAWENKKMSVEALQAFLIKIQRELGCTFLLTFGTDREKKEAERIHQGLPLHSQLIDRLPLPALQFLMSRVSLVVAMDSLPLHLAATTSTPSFSIFGASASHKYQPKGKQHRIFQGLCPYGQVFEKRCPYLRTCPTGACIKSYSGDELYEAFSNRFFLEYCDLSPHSKKNQSSGL